MGRRRVNAVRGECSRSRLGAWLLLGALCGCGAEPGTDAAGEGSGPQDTNSGDPTDPSNGDDPANPTQTTVPAGQFRITGTVAPQVAPSQRTLLSSPVEPRHVTHVMALNPEASAPDRVLVEVQEDGSFTLDVAPGRPYVLVFIDASRVGTDMVVAVFRAQTLDTLAPLEAEGSVDLEQVGIDEATQTATAGTSYDSLLEQLGLSPEGAEYLGAIDDLSLRYANPDVDGNGVLDELEDLRITLDFHLRSNVQKGSSGQNLRFSDMTDTFFAESGPDVATLIFNLCSIYVLYPSSLDTTQYVATPPTAELQNGGAFTATHSDGSDVFAPSSFSFLALSEITGWGPDYSVDQGVEMPGSAASPAALNFYLAAVETTLTFSNVLTKSAAELAAEGTLMPFLKFNTEGGLITSIDYKWMKKAGGAWLQATAEEVGLVVNDNGGYASLYRHAKEFRIGLQIPPEPTGTLPWTRDAVSEANVTDEELANTTPDDLCSSAISYDDKLGLRIFAGGAEANEGVTPCY